MKDNHEKLWGSMVTGGIEGHTNNPDTPSFPKRWIIRGLSRYITKEEVADDILAETGAKVTIKQFTRRKPDGEPSDRLPSPLFAMTAQSGDDARKIVKMRLIFHHTLPGRSRKNLI